MIRNRLINTFLCIWIGIGIVHAQTDTSLLTFEHAMQMVHDKNPSLQRVRGEVKQKEYEQGVRRGLYMPKVSVSAKAATLSEPLHLDLTDIRDAILPIYEVLGNYGVFNGIPYVNPETGEFITILDEATSTEAVRRQLLEGSEEVANGDWDPVIQESTFVTASADFSWPVFTGGKIAGANKAAGVELEISHEELRKTTGELLTELVTRYYGLVLASQASDVMKEKYEAMQKHYNDAKKMFEEGMIAKVELLSASVALSDAEREYKKALRMVSTIRSGLSATLATESDTCFVPANNLFVNKDLPGLDYWLSQTWSSNPQLRQISYKKDLVDIKTKVSKGDYLPTVAVIGTYNLADYDLSPYMPEWMIGAGMSWTIFDGMARHKQVKADLTLKEQVSFIEEKAQDDLRAYIIKLYNELNNDLVEIEELKKTLQLAEEYSSSTQKAFNEGFANSTSVVEAQSKLAQVKALRLKAFYQYDVTLSTLLQVSGVPEQFLTYCSGENARFESINK